ncbi:16S rRNA processing protein RimM [Candidatus Nitrosoglobus terrae]|uniref:Ribosome maturation factor RimM n=1 Tax=Candidatus Nitrosoglobus terrae TaxID=1630141 RepID=A0A1Q2SM52_9GAMM|nr:ribosome maturation factor RimM [Candidatus Nitrosoglobus terrae]BAW80202.1 16S rRNA processing protein RimM [Candidatus Nitrosoglobus terrae]
MEQNTEDNNNRYVLIGHISGLYGVQGWVRVHSYTEPQNNILHYMPWYLRQDSGWLERKLINGRVHGKSIVVALEGINNRDLATSWVNHEIAVHCRQLLPLGRDEYYWADLIGLQVVTEYGVVLGQVNQLLETGANDVLVVQGERERLIPFLIGLTIKQIDCTQKLMTVSWDPDF